MSTLHDENPEHWLGDRDAGNLRPKQPLTVGRIEQLTNTPVTEGTLRALEAGLPLPPGIPKGILKSTAYLVGFIDKSTSEFLGFWTFSERTPTTCHYSFSVLHCDGATYREAEEKLLKELDRPFWGWAKTCLRERDKPLPARPSALLAKAVALLDEAEWEALDSLRQRACPWCGGSAPLEFEPTYGHAAACAYVAFKREVAPCL